MKTLLLSIAVLLVSTLGRGAEEHASSTPDPLLVQSGGLNLHALLWRPAGRGPFPAILFNHGSGHATGMDASGRHDRRRPDLLGPVFAKHGYVFLYLFRRGDGLSIGQGIPSADLMDAELAARGQDARNTLQLRLLEAEMEDDVAALQVLRRMPVVDKNRVAVVGHSFGGSLTLLLAERDQKLRAAVVFSNAGYSWERSTQLRERLLKAVQSIAAPVLFIHAENDYSLGPGKVLDAEMARLGHAHRLVIYPPIGQTLDDGHDFIHLGVLQWEPDVFAFLDAQVRR